MAEKGFDFVVFLVFLVVLFPAFFGLCYVAGCFPEEEGKVLSEVKSGFETAEPVRISAGEVGIDFKVANPGNSDIKTLDAALSQGVVRYPGSAKLGEEGNILLFGHSSFLPIVRNPAYKALNGVMDLKKGDMISVYSERAEYRYRVNKITLAEAGEILVDLRKTGGKRLTISTCNSFGAKEERYVAEAEFVGSYLLES